MIKRVIRGKGRRLTVLVAMIGLLTACHSPLADTPTGDEYILAKDSYRETVLPTEAMPVAELAGLPEDCEAYAWQISRYYLPLAEGWTSELCAGYGLSEALPAFAGAPERLGFACMDFNGDGADELLIGSTDPQDPVVLELWAIVNDKPKLLAQAENESRYYLHQGKSKYDYIWENATGPEGNETAAFYFTFNGTFMEYLWDIFPGISDEKQDEYRAAAAESCGERILPNYISYAALNAQ